MLVFGDPALKAVGLVGLASLYGRVQDKFDVHDNALDIIRGHLGRIRGVSYHDVSKDEAQEWIDRQKERHNAITDEAGPERDQR